MVDHKVLIGVSTGEYARRADFYDYFNLLNKGNSLVILAHDRSPAHNRNIIVEQAFEHNCTHVLFVDDDMTFDADALDKLVKHDVDIVSGLYLRRDYPHQPLIFDSLDDEGRALYSYLDGELSGLLPIEAAGLGFCLVNLNVFKKMQKPWVRLGELDPAQWCDDIGFFFRAKKEANAKVFCDTSVLCGHIGTVIIRPVWDKATKSWMTGYDTNGKGMIQTPQLNPDYCYEFRNEEKSV